MSMRSKSLITVLVFAVPAFFLSRVLWQDAPGFPVPTSGQLPFFIVLGVVEALAFGIGMTFAIKLWSKARMAGADVFYAFLAVTWLLVSWWPHDNFHRANGEDLQGLLYIEYAFHLTLIIAAVILAKFFVKYLKDKSSA